MNKLDIWRNPMIYVKPRTNKESRDIIQRLHDIGKTEFYNYGNGEQIKLSKDVKPFYSVILLADVVPLNKLFGKDYIFCIDKRKEKVNIIPERAFPPGTSRIRTYKEFMEIDTFELLGSFKEMDSINREAAKLIEYGIGLPIDCCERFDLTKQIDKHKLFEKITNRYIKVDTKEQLLWVLALCCEHGVVTMVYGHNNNGTSEYVPGLLRDYIVFNFSFEKTWYLYIWYDFSLLRTYENVPENEDVLSAETLMKIYKEEVK